MIRQSRNVIRRGTRRDDFPCGSALAQIRRRNNIETVGNRLNPRQHARHLAARTASIAADPAYPVESSEQHKTLVERCDE